MLSGYSNHSEETSVGNGICTDPVPVPDAEVEFKLLLLDDDVS